MRKVAEVLSADEWQKLRDLESQIFERQKELTPVLYPGYGAADNWASGELDFDSTGYSVEPQQIILGSKKRLVSLTLFDLRNARQPMQKFARLYELDLRSGREDIRVYPVHLKLAMFGVSRATWEDRQLLALQKRSARELGGRKADFTAANKSDVELVREQLERGASGVW